MEKVKYMSLLKLNYTVVILVNGEIFFEIFKVLALQFFFFWTDVLQGTALPVSHFN